MKTIAVYGDSPTVPTGFGRVVRDIFRNLTDSFQVKLFGVNYNGYPHQMPFEIYPAALPTAAGPYDPYGRAHFRRWLTQQSFDLLFVLNDGWLLRNFLPEMLAELRKRRGDVPVVVYFPVDAEETHRDWYSWLAEHVTRPVTYTEFGRRTIIGLVPELANRLEVIPHGVDPTTFKVVSDCDLLARARTLAGGGFAFLNVNRNQVRKNIPGTLAAMRRYSESEPSDHLVLHMAPADPLGCNVELVADSLGFREKGVIRMSASRVDDRELNLIYNSCGATMTTSIGEGWGLSMTESIMAGVPVIAPRHTSFPEVVRDFGLLYDPGLRHCGLPHGTDRSNWRYYCDPEVVARAMLEVRQHHADWVDRALEGRRWYSANGTWRDHVAPRWRQLFRQLLS